MPTCSDISENAHTLLKHLTRTRARNVGMPRVKGDLDTWSRDLPLERESIRLAFEEIGPDGDEFVRQDQHGRLILWLLCECPTGSRTDSSISPGPLAARRTGHKPGRWASSTRSASMILPASRVNEKFSGDDETPGQSPETFFLNGASADDEVAQPPAENAATLVTHFVGKVMASASRQGVRVMPGSIKQGALGRHFKTLLDGGVEPGTVRAMIDSFAANYRRYHKPGSDPGVVFLAHRRRLFAEAEKRATLAVERDITRLKKPGRKYATAADILGDKTA